MEATKVRLEAVASLPGTDGSNPFPSSGESGANLIFGGESHLISALIALSCPSVPSSLAPISREYPATSAARIAARRRLWLMLLRQPPTAGPTAIVRDALGYASALHPVQSRA